MISLIHQNVNLLFVITFFINLSLFYTPNEAQQVCKTPDNEYGYCLPYRKCPEYFDHLQQTQGANLRNFLQSSRCNDNQDVHLCCHENFVTTDSFVGLDSFSQNLNQKGLQVLTSIKDCGNVSTRRVAFGEEAVLAEFPWMALIEYDLPEQPYQCGGSLITNRYVLTAAHCIVGVDRVTGVILGEHNLDTDPDCQPRGRRMACSPPRERYGVERLIPHPEYRRRYIGYDIALLKLNAPVVYKKHIVPVCLPITPYTLQPQTRFLIVGWGTTETGSTSRVLLKAGVGGQDRSVCENIFRRQRITSHHLCVGGNGPIDTCKGDSGGPLFTSTTYTPNKARYVQYGIVSFGGVNCSLAQKLPAIYTNITEFMPWITSNIIA